MPLVFDLRSALSLLRTFDRRPKIFQSIDFQVEQTTFLCDWAVARSGWQTQPAPPSVVSGIIGEGTLAHKVLCAPRELTFAWYGSRAPTFQPRRIRKLRLGCELHALDARDPSIAPSKPIRSQHGVSTRSTRGLPELHEQITALLRERCMAKTFGIQEPGSGRPISVLIGEHAIENQDLFTIGMIVDWKLCTRVVANEGSDLAGFGRTDAMETFAPDRLARTGNPLKQFRIDDDPLRKITMQRRIAISISHWLTRTPICRL